MDIDGPLDFESEDLVFNLTTPVKKRRRKVIDLDHLLTDYYLAKTKLVEKESKNASVYKCYDSDEDAADKDRENKVASLSMIADECEKKVNEIVNEDEIPLWGQRIFGDRKASPALIFHGVESCNLLQSFICNELNSVVELTADKGEEFLQGLLLNGWLSRLVAGHIEDSIALWTFDLMLYSSKEELQVSACDFWCSILSSNNEVDLSSVRLERIPFYAKMKDALDIYGYIRDSTNISCSTMVSNDLGSMGPPQNIRSWIKFLTACCRARNRVVIFMADEVEDFLYVVIHLFLDRQLQGLSLLLQECLLSVVSFFTDDEWRVSCEKVANSLAHSIPKNVNCLRIVECISGVNIRSKQFRREVAYQILRNCIGAKDKVPEEVLTPLIEIDMKEKDCDLFRIYICLFLADKWLFCNHLLEDRPVLQEMWSLFLRTCSCQIMSTDWRSYASKVRNKASYLVQVYQHNPKHM